MSSENWLSKNVFENQKCQFSYENQANEQKYLFFSKKVKFACFKHRANIFQVVMRFYQQSGAYSHPDKNTLLHIYLSKKK